MNIGNLRHRVQLQVRAPTKDEYGAEIDGWADLASVWASVEALSGRELFAAQQTTAEADHQITMRYRADVKPDMRALEGDRVFDITAALDREGRKRKLELLCREVVNDAATG